MKDSEKTNKLSSSSLRIHFPDDERKFPWLCMLLDAYAIIDEGIAVAVKAEEEELKIKLACREGCDNCCRTHRDIPIYPLELIGISWFATERVVEPLRSLLKEQLARHGEEDPCPFLINGSCAVHLLRPIACRQFNVFSEQCDEGEDPYFTRRDDVLSPIRDYTDRAFAAMLSFYGIPEDADKVRAARSIIQTQAINLQSFDWKTLVGLMEDFDSKNPRS
jgi:Fe-S-cluster containining protein